MKAISLANCRFGMRNVRGYAECKHPVDTADKT